LVRGLKILAGTFATSVPAYFLAQLLFSREFAIAVGFATALGASSALQAQTRPTGSFGWRSNLLLGVIVAACLTPLLWLLFR
jgi:nucleoside recognition membrane protein YjiH